MNYIKRIIGILGTGLMTAALFTVRPVSEDVEIVDTIEPEEIHYLTDEELSMLYTCKQDIRKNNPDIIEVDYNEAQMLMKIGKVEHGSGSPEAQANVMMTVINRTHSNSFPNSIDSVIHQSGQFSTVSSGQYANAIPDLDCHLALALLEEGKINHDALYFEATHVQNSWMSKHKTLVFESEGHRFYK